MVSTRETSRLLTVDEVAARLRLSRQSVYRLVSSGIIPAVRVGGDQRGPLRVPADELSEWLDGRRTTTKETMR